MHKKAECADGCVCFIVSRLFYRRISGLRRCARFLLDASASSVLGACAREPLSEATPLLALTRAHAASGRQVFHNPEQSDVLRAAMRAAAHELFAPVGESDEHRSSTSTSLPLPSDRPRWLPLPKGL